MTGNMHPRSLAGNLHLGAWECVGHCIYGERSEGTCTMG